MSEFTDVPLVGPRGRSGVLRIYPERCQVRFEDWVSVGDGSLPSLYQAVEKRQVWHGGGIIVKPVWIFDRVEIQAKPPHLSEFQRFTGKRSELVAALLSVFEANT